MGPIEEYIQNDLKVDLKKESAFFTEWDPSIVQKTIDDHSKVVKWQMEKGYKQISGIPWIIDDYAESSEILHARGNNLQQNLHFGKTQPGELYVHRSGPLVSEYNNSQKLTCALFYPATAKESQFIEDEYRPHEVSRDDFRQFFEECAKEKYSF